MPQRFFKKKTTESFSVVYADKTFLPLRRRLAKTLRPFLVLIRVRKPCTFFLLRLLG
ncbi:ribosomal protein L34 [Listeria monocytogenes]|nr:ribosomal protein L34 [Listeria monocytogenes]